MMLPNFDEFPNGIPFHHAIPHHTSGRSDQSRNEQHLTDAPKAPKRASYGSEESGYLSRIEERDVIVPKKASLLGLPAEMRLRVIRRYIVISNHALEGDWTYDKAKFPETKSLSLLCVNKRIRNEAMPFAQQLLIVLPRYLKVRWMVNLPVFDFSVKPTPWWSSFVTICVTSWDHLGQALK